MKNNTRKIDAHWREKLQKDLEFHSYIISACIYSRDQENKSELSVPRKTLLEANHIEQYSQTLCQDTQYDNDTLELYLSKFQQHKILFVNSTVLVNFSSRSLLETALRLYGNTQSSIKIENEVYIFIRGNLSFNPSCVSGFKVAVDLINDLYINNTKKSALTEIDLISLLKSALQESHKPEIIRAFIEVGFIKRLFSLERNRNNVLNITGKGNIWFLLSALFGLHTDIEGLPLLFYGTLPIYNPPGNNIFIRGGLGCGKSTLASQIAYEVADKGGISIYLALEENTAILENLYASFGWTNNDDVIFNKIQITEKTFKDQLSGALNIFTSSHKGLFILADVHAKDFIDLYDLIDMISSGFLHKIKKTSKLIVLDSVNAVKVFQKQLPELELRQSMTRLLDRIQHAGCCSILVGEEHTNENSPFFFEESISDTTIRLFFSEESYKKRSIEVCKSRLIPCVRGENRFIIDHKGIVVYPSASSFIAARQGRRYNATGKTRKMKSGVEGLDEMFGDKGIESGTITGFIGEAGTGKMELALCWLSNGVLSNNEASIYVTFSKAPKYAVSLLNNRAKIVFQHFKNKQLSFKNFDNLFSVVSMRTDGLTAGQIIHTISTEINKKKQMENVRSVRIVIDSLTQLEYSSCSDEDNRSFLCALEETVKTDAISCILCYTRDMYREAPTLMEQKLINISDNRLEFKKVDVSGIQKTIVYTERSRSYNHPHEAMELVVDDEIKIEPNFSLFAEIRNGETTAIKTEVFLHYEGKVHKKYNDSIERFISSAVGENVTVHNQLYPQISKNQIIRRGMLEKSIRLVSVDDLDLDLITEEDYHFIPTNLLNNAQSDYLKCVDKRIRTNDRKHYKALPLYVNIPILLCKKGTDKKLGESINSWRELADWLVENDKDTQVPAFEFSKGVAENYNCMFLEILHSLVMEKATKPEDESFGASFYRYLRDDSIGGEAILLFWRLCHKAHLLSKPHKDELSTTNNDTLDTRAILKINPSFSFCRTWFTSIYDIFEEKEDSYNIKTLPGTGSVLGTWYLTVPKRGPASEIAKKLCVAICGREQAIERFDNWIGIPPYSSLCGISEDLKNLNPGIDGTTINFARKYLSTIAETAIVRTEIPRYSAISGLLSFYLQRILEIEGKPKSKVPEDNIKAELKNAIKAINKQK